MNEKLVYSLFICLLFFIPTVYAQNGQNSIAVTPMLGLTISSPDDNALKGSFYGAEFAYQLNMKNNNNPWVHLLHVKDISFILTYFNLQNISLTLTPNSHGLLGSNLGALTSLDMSFFHIGKADFLFSPGIGFIYATQTYYTDYNPIVGSHINLAIQAGVKMETPISSSTKLQGGLNFFHYSNSAFKLPNDGVNAYNLSIGIVQNINSDKPVQQKAAFDIDKKQSFELSIGIGRRGFIQTGQYVNAQTGKPIILTDSASQKAANSNLYQAGLYAGYNYRINQLFSLKAGTDAVYYLVPFSYQKFYHTFQESGTSFDRLSLGFSTGIDVWLGRMAFMASYGYYLHYVTINPTHTYWTIGGKYFLNSWLALNAKIYIHGLEAHYANFGVVFQLY